MPVQPSPAGGHCACIRGSNHQLALAEHAHLRSHAPRHQHSLARRVPVDLLADPSFMAVSVVGVCLLGISKGGFLGLGVIALPLMALFVPPLQAAGFCPGSVGGFARSSL